MLRSWLPAEAPLVFSLTISTWILSSRSVSFPGWTRADEGGHKNHNSLHVSARFSLLLKQVVKKWIAQHVRVDTDLVAARLLLPPEISS